MDRDQSKQVVLDMLMRTEFTPWCRKHQADINECSKRDVGPPPPHTHTIAERGAVMPLMHYPLFTVDSKWLNMLTWLM